MNFSYVNTIEDYVEAVKIIYFNYAMLVEFVIKLIKPFYNWKIIEYFI